MRYLWNDNPGKISMFALRAARLTAVIPLIDKHVTVSSLPKQLPIILRNDDDSSWTLGAAAAIAKTADRTTNTFILVDFAFLRFDEHENFGWSGVTLNCSFKRSQLIWWVIDGAAAFLYWSRTFDFHAAEARCAYHLLGMLSSISFFLCVSVGAFAWHDPWVPHSQCVNRGSSLFTCTGALVCDDHGHWNFSEPLWLRLQFFIRRK